LNRSEIRIARRLDFHAGDAGPSLEQNLVGDVRGARQRVDVHTLDVRRPGAIDILAGHNEMEVDAVAAPFRGEIAGRDGYSDQRGQRGTFDAAGSKQCDQ